MSTENWPLSPSGVPERAALLDWDADLPAFSWHCPVQAGGFRHPFYTARPGLGEMSFFYTGASLTGVQVFVPESLLEAARAILSPEENPAEE
ncbi:MAG: hypothetical protein ACLSAF_12130 [Intestinimonas sp.]